MSPALESSSSRNIFGDDISFNLLKHEDSIELVVSRVAAGEGRWLLVSASLLAMTGFLLTTAFADQVLCSAPAPHVLESNRLISPQSLSSSVCLGIVLLLLTWCACTLLSVTEGNASICDSHHLRNESP